MRHMSATPTLSLADVRLHLLLESKGSAIRVRSLIWRLQVLDYWPDENRRVPSPAGYAESFTQFENRSQLRTVPMRLRSMLTTFQVGVKHNFPASTSTRYRLMLYDGRNSSFSKSS
jgi:hypothetical protein